MSEFKRACSKCKEFFNEKELQVSHDIPKYLGGGDKDGRHLLCEKCHKEYEYLIFRSASSYLKNIYEVHKINLRKIASKIKEDFFK
jgi:5-methylcytosine-specific restriction endonuclease McrA